MQLCKTVVMGSLLAVLLACRSGPAAHLDAATAHFQRAERLTAEGKLAEATREYRIGLAIEPSARAYNNLGVIFFKKGRPSQAAAAFTHAHQLLPSDLQIEFNLGLALYESSDFVRAIPHLEAASRVPLRAGAAHYLLGSCYFDLKQWPSAIGELQKAQSTGDERPEVLFLLAKTYAGADDPQKSVATAIELLKRYPGSPLADDMLGETYDAAGQPREAVRQFTSAIAASPQAPVLHFALGYVYWRWKHYGEAISPLKDEIRINPKCAECYFYLGDCLLKQGHPQLSEAAFEKAMALKPAYGEAYLGMGQAQAALGNLPRALSFLRKAAVLMPNQAAPHLWLGRTLIRTGRNQEGQEELAKVRLIRQREGQRDARILNRVR
jgi:tetratricopeptide (TPR) repeat protein